MAKTLHCAAAVAAATDPDDCEQPGWVVRTGADGGLTASIAGSFAGSDPAMTVCGKDPDDLRRRIRQTVLRAML